MAEQPAVSYTYEEKEEKPSYEYTYKPTGSVEIEKVPTHKILHSIAMAFPHAASRIAPFIAHQARVEHPHTRASALWLGSGILGLMADAEKHRLAHIELKEKQGMKLTTFEANEKLRLSVKLAKIERYKTAIDTHRKAYDEGYMGKPTAISPAETYYFEKMAAEPYERSEVSKAAKRVVHHKKHKMRHPSYRMYPYPKMGAYPMGYISERERRLRELQALI